MVRIVAIWIFFDFIFENPSRLGRVGQSGQTIKNETEYLWGSVS
ncbi:hypothetical protein [Streptococcus merionis]